MQRRVTIEVGHRARGQYKSITLQFCTMFTCENFMCVFAKGFYFFPFSKEVEYSDFEVQTIYLGLFFTFYEFVSNIC